MKLSLQVKVGQSLTITPQLQQAIRLLQLSNVQLQSEVQKILEANIMLEIAEDSHTTQSATKNSVTSITDEHPTKQNTNTSTEPENIPEQLPVDSTWEDIYNGISNETNVSFSSGYGNSATHLENQNSHNETLREHLFWQLNLTHLSDVDKVIATTIIDALDEKGYLNCSLEDIRTSLDDKTYQNMTLGKDIDNADDKEWLVELDEVEAVLHMVQTLEPTGIGARNLSECLLLQLRQCHKDTPYLDLAIKLIAKHTSLLAKRDFDQIMKQLKINQEKMQQTMGLIQSLDPHPGRQIHETPTEYIIPDVYVNKIAGKWHVELNTELMPHLRINSSYANMADKTDNSVDKISLKSHLQEAKWFIKNLQNRNKTLSRVATCIVERQQAFMKHGEEAMKPMILNDVAEILEMHESTISRITTHKYMHTPRGIFELKYFFSSHLNTNHGEQTSSIAIRALIKKLITEETPKKPLSDEKITSLLLEKGIKVARRTVAKYRETMTIPPSNERKRLA